MASLLKIHPGEVELVLAERLFQVQHGLRRTSLTGPIAVQLGEEIVLSGQNAALHALQGISEMSLLPVLPPFVPQLSVEGRLPAQVAHGAGGGGTGRFDTFPEGDHVCA